MRSIAPLFVFTALFFTQLGWSETSFDYVMHKEILSRIIKNNFCATQEKECLADIDDYMELNSPPFFPDDYSVQALRLASNFSRELCKKPSNVSDRWECYNNAGQVFSELANYYGALELLFKGNLTGSPSDAHKLNTLRLLKDESEVESWRLTQLYIEYNGNDSKIELLNAELAQAPETLLK